MGEGGTEQDHGRVQSRVFARPGLIGSFLLHTAVLGLLLYQMGAPPLALPIVPVDVVQLADETASAASPPEAPARAPGASAPPRLASVAPPRAAVQPPPPEPVRPPAAPPSAERPAPDALPPTRLDPLQGQLDALAKRRMQNEGNPGPSGSNVPGTETGYRVEDLIRAQVLRRWNLRLDELGESDLVITIHVVLEPDGTVAKAEIIDTSKVASDDVYRSIALSARNAVLLSSPLTLPAGMSAEMRDMTLSFNTRDTQR